jgi:hypothetical protein
MEFIRCEDKSFAEGVRRAAAIGYKYVEPMLHNGRELLSEAGYFHSVSMDDDPVFIKDVCDANGVVCSGVSAHTPLMRPEIAVPYLEKAIRFAKGLGAPVVNTDEGIRPAWLDDQEIWTVMRYTLKKVLPLAERHGVYIGIEPHQSLSKTTAGLLRISTLVDSPMLGGGGRPRGPHPREGHLHPARRRGEGEGDRHPCWLRLRRRGHRLEARRGNPARRRLRRRSLRRMRHPAPGGPFAQTPQ